MLDVMNKAMNGDQQSYGAVQQRLLRIINGQ
jgi:hypothetical protein